jgi:uncharacterized protein
VRGKNKLVLIALVLAVAVLVSGCGTVASNSAEAPRVIQAYGEAELTAAPDLARISLVIETRSNSALDAVEENARLANAVREALLDYGLSEDDLTTGNYNLYSYKEWYEGLPFGEEAPITYNATNEIVVTTKQLETVGEIIDLSVKAGANNVNYVSFELEDPQDLLMEALGLASGQARQKADAIAGGTGDEISGLQTIREERTDFMPYRYSDMAAQEGLGMGAPTPINPGDVTIRAAVVAEFLIK